MHEMSLAESVLQILEQAATTQGFRRVTAVRLEIGALSSVEPEAMRFCFDAVTRHSLADGAKLEILTLPGSAWCSRCADSVPVETLYDDCPACGNPQLQAIAGTEMRVKELDVE